MATNASNPSGKAIRLTMAYDATGVRVVSQQSVEMTLPPSDPAPAAAVQGVWSELRDGQDNTSFRRRLHAPFRPDVEVFSGEPGRTVSRKPVENTSGVFVVVVPEIEGADQLVLVQGSQPGAGGAAATADAAVGPREIARFKLAKPAPSTGGPT